MAVVNVADFYRALLMPLADVSNTEWRSPWVECERDLLPMPLADVSNTEWRVAKAMEIQAEQHGMPLADVSNTEWRSKLELEKFALEMNATC